jgi:hypothetical protein
MMGGTEDWWMEHTNDTENEGAAAKGEGKGKGAQPRWNFAANNYQQAGKHSEKLQYIIIQ